jgi:large subunit ribosomal protein L19
MDNLIANSTKKLDEKQLTNQSYINFIEQKHINKALLEEQILIKPGNILRIGYRIPVGDKERIQYYEGLVIAVQNRTLSRTFKIRRTVQGIGVEQTFLANSPKIVSIIKKQTSKIRRAKLFFVRHLTGKSARLKIKN